MISTFKDKETERVFNREPSRSFPPDIQRTAFRKLRMLNRAVILADLKIPPSNRLEKLSGGRKGQYSIRINDQWRICFVWENGTAQHVEIVDYH